MIFMNQYFMPIYTTVVGVVIGLLVAWVKSLISRKKEEQAKEDDTYEALKQGMAILLRRQLFDYYNIYINEESIPKSEWEEIEQTHRVYNKLGGNHTGDRLYSELQSKHLDV